MANVMSNFLTERCSGKWFVTGRFSQYKGSHIFISGYCFCCTNCCRLLKKKSEFKKQSAKQAAALLLRCQPGGLALNTRPDTLMICFMGHIRTEI